ncbi:MAG: asparagine synthetase B [Anaerolineae bacterium]|nr:asparagine synthetase B [Anaerolineae bacterium]MDH7473679.1 asparagine synthase-related protein [Anaerolineae bacterium]
MAGIFGIYDPEMAREHLIDLALRMQSVITHQSWYQGRTVAQPPLAAGRVGLGIVNPQPQPASNEDETVLVWMDGEIYDFQRQELSRRLQAAGHRLEGKGDAELLAHLYEDEGEDCFYNLDGTFAVAIFDNHLNKLLIGVDRDASRQLYFYTCDNRFLFASEVKAILQDHRVPRRLDEQGLVEFFTFRHPLGERTLIRDVRFLPAGCLVVFCNGQAQVRRYWEPVVVDDFSRSREEYLAELEAGLRWALERQLYDDRPIGEMLSGGLDSRLLAGMIPPQRMEHFHTFSRGPLECWDVRFGTLVARAIGSQHHIFELKPDFLPPLARQGVWLTDGLMTVMDIYELSSIELVKSCVDVVFLGLGRGCGILGGVELSKRLLEARNLDEAAQEFFARQGTYIPQDMQARLLSGQLYKNTQGAAFETFRQMLESCQADTPAGQVEVFCIQCRWPRSANYGPFLARTQVETRHPYNDNDFSDLACRVPARWRLKRQMEIALLKRVRPDLARIPYDYTGLPASVSTPTVMFIQRGLYYMRRRASYLTRGWIPAGTERERANYPVWFRTSLRKWLEGILLDRRTLGRGYLNEAFLRQMIRDHMNGRRDYSIQFGLLLTFELWNRLFIDGEPVTTDAPG